MNDETQFVRFFDIRDINHSPCAEKKTTTKKSRESEHQKFE